MLNKKQAKNTNSIIRINNFDSNASNTGSTKQLIIKEIDLINKEIFIAGKNFLLAEEVKLKSSLNINQGFWRNIQARRHAIAAERSANWHLEHLKDLCKQRVILQKKLFREHFSYIPKPLYTIACTSLKWILFIAISIIIFLGLMSLIPFLPILVFLTAIITVISKRGKV